MTKEYYEKRLAFLKECQALVERLISNGYLKDGIVAHMIGARSLKKSIVDQLLQDNLAFHDNTGDLCINQKLGTTYIQNFYINRIQQLLSSFNTESAIVNSSRAAEQSAASATKANKYARNANYISILALLSSILSPIVLFFITKCCSN